MNQPNGMVFDGESWICGVQFGIVMEGEGEAAADAGAEGAKPAAEGEGAKPAQGAEGGEGEGAGGEGEGTGAVAASASGGGESEDWRDKRIAQLTARLRAAEASKPANDPAASGGDGDFESRVQAEASKRAAQAEFNRQCNEVAKSGRELFPDFDTRVQALQRLTDSNDPQSLAQYNTFIAAAIETGEAPKLLHELGANLNEASRIMGLSPVKMGVELAKLASGKGTAVSNAPKPIVPLGGRGQNHEKIEPDDPVNGAKLDKKTWFERREAQVAQRAVH